MLASAAVSSAVALRKESVDRNNTGVRSWIGSRVALRKESVDRNVDRLLRVPGVLVALRKESVDRNLRLTNKDLPVKGRSPQGERG